METLPFLLIMEFCQLVRGLGKGRAYWELEASFGLRTWGVLGFCGLLCGFTNFFFPFYIFWGQGLNPGYIIHVWQASDQLG